MPDKQLTIATYAAGASLAAITLVYVFGPTFFIDGEPSGSSANSRKRGAVGLSNPANDCFINSVLQALAGLGDLRLYLIRETHRRELDGPRVYSQLVEDPARPGVPAWKVEGLQAGIVTHGLKVILDRLNERPLYKKTISAAQFVACLEQAFKQRISRQQQDAQEFLQVVAERLCDEYHAGHRARAYARNLPDQGDLKVTLDEESVDQKLNQLSLENDITPQQTPTISEPEPATSSIPLNTTAVKSTGMNSDRILDVEEEDGFPLEGGLESQIECLTCGFKPKASKTTFCSLTLSVPQINSTSLNSCFDQMFKTEYIEDFKCEKCRLIHALDTFEQEFAKSNSEKFKVKTQKAIEILQAAIKTDPEGDVQGVVLPDTKYAPKRKIAKHTQITKFPKVMAIHLSRSIFDQSRSTTKNSAKVQFPELLPLGGLLNQRKYKLSSVVCHKGSHHSGHYESFRRQTLLPPFSTRNTFQVAGVYSKPPTPNPSEISTPQMQAVQKIDDSNLETSTLSSTPEGLSPMSAASSLTLSYANGRPSGESLRNGHLSSSTSINNDATAKVLGPTSAPRDPETSSIRSVARSARNSITSKLSPSRRSTPDTLNASDTADNKVADVVRKKRKKASNDRWHRISDEKVKEAKTSEVLAMQKEVYLLFYELMKEDEA